MTETLIFPSGSVSGSTLTLTVDIKDDKAVEEEEYFTVNIISMDIDIRIDEAKRNASIFIEDDDCKDQPVTS